MHQRVLNGSWTNTLCGKIWHDITLDTLQAKFSDDLPSQSQNTDKTKHKYNCVVTQKPPQPRNNSTDICTK